MYDNLKLEFFKNLLFKVYLPKITIFYKNLII